VLRAAPAGGSAYDARVLGALWTFALTTATMIAFAANSLLCRAALRGGAIDAMSFTAIRLFSGALVLVAITQARRGGDDAGRHGSWGAAIALGAYAPAFSLAYLRLGAGAGALLLFGSVQFTMITGGLVRGERPSLRQWVGLAVAAVGMVVINLPSLDAPPPSGAALMIAAGVGWGIYSLRGRGARRPIRATAGNFVRCLPFTAVFAAIAVAATAEVTTRGVVFAVVSGAVTSGLGYCLWYAVLPSLGAARGAIVQLSVPVIASAGAIVLLDEPLRRHVAIGGAIILGGLALALWQLRPVPSPAAAPLRPAGTPPRT
jgi:drug/metabolite transporter (DMT)-like permease